MNGITLDNVVFDDIQPNLSSLGQITAQGNIATTQTNVYPALFNQLNTNSRETTNVGNTQMNLDANTYDVITSMSSQTKAYQCSSQRPPFTVGELYVSIGSPATGSSTNLQQVQIDGGGSITLNAVVQPVMSQTTFFNPKGYGAKPGLLAVGSPALTNPIVFYEDERMIGTANCRRTVTLASLTVDNVQPGTHTFTARYSADPYYDTLDFGSVIVHARWPFDRASFPAGKIRSNQTVAAGPMISLATTKGNSHEITSHFQLNRRGSLCPVPVCAKRRGRGADVRPSASFRSGNSRSTRISQATLAGPALHSIRIRFICPHRMVSFWQAVRSLPTFIRSSKRSPAISAACP